MGLLLNAALSTWGWWFGWHFVRVRMVGGMLISDSGMFQPLRTAALSHTKMTNKPRLCTKHYLHVQYCIETAEKELETSLRPITDIGAPFTLHRT